MKPRRLSLLSLLVAGLAWGGEANLTLAPGSSPAASPTLAPGSSPAASLTPDPGGSPAASLTPDPGGSPAASLTPDPGGSPAATRLTQRDALRLGLTNLLQARVARELRAELRQAPEVEQGVFDWQLSASASDGKLESGTINNRFSGLANLYFTDLNSTLDSRSASLGLSKLDAYGGTLSFNLNTGYNAASYLVDSQTLPAGPSAALSYATLNPYSGSLSLSYTQPLLRGFGRSATEARLLAALADAKGADESFRARMMELLTLVDNLYWDQVFAGQNLANKLLALKLAQTHLQEDQEKVKAKMLAPIELPQVEATVAEREKQVLAAQARLSNARLALVSKLFPDGDQPQALELTDSPGSGPELMPLAAARALALSHRPEIAQASLTLSANRALEQAASSAALPQLDSQIAVLRNTSTSPDLNGSLTDLSQGHYPGYYIGLSFSYPLGNRARLARLSQARAATRGTEYLVKDIRTSVALDVEQAYTDLSTARKQVEASDKALRFRQESMDAEMAKLENGMSTSFYVLQRQEELDQARSTDLEDRISAEKARTNLARDMGTLVESAE